MPHEGGGGEGGVPHNPSFLALILEHFFHNHQTLVNAEAISASVITAAVIVLLAYLLTRNMQRVPNRLQAAVEWVVEQLDGFTRNAIGPQSRTYLALVGTLFIYILLMNLGGVIPLWTSPTANMNVTIALAISVFIYVQYEGIRVNGIKGYFRHFVGEPVWLAPLNFPLHVIGELARPVSLSVRLFGNIFGEDTVIAVLIALVAPLVIPFKFIPLHFPMLLLSLFTSFVQAMVFAILTCIYIAGFVVHEDGHGEHHAEAHTAIDQHPPRVPA